MFTAAFWKATFERMIRGGAIAAGAAWSGDAVFNVMELTNLKDVASLFASGAILSGLLCLAGNFATKSGPSFNNSEVVPAEVAPPPPVAGDAGPVA